MEAVDERSNKAPVVVVVSLDVDESRAKEPPLAMTDVVCGMMKAVPVVTPLAVIETPEPAVVLAVVTLKTLAAPVVEVPVKETKLPV